jgi:serine/threonine protein kinase
LRGESDLLPVEMVLKIATQIADALNYAHAMGATHGSIGLDNILVTGHGVAKLAELGFAKGLENLGQVHKGIGQFTAPEQIGPPPKTEARSDIYALGGVLFALLSGSLPFKAATEQELALKIRAGKRESLQKLRSSLPSNVIKIVDKAMAPAIKDRYANASEMQKALAAAAAKLH